MYWADTVSQNRIIYTTDTASNPHQLAQYFSTLFLCFGFKVNEVWDKNSMEKQIAYKYLVSRYSDRFHRGYSFLIAIESVPLFTVIEIWLFYLNFPKGLPLLCCGKNALRGCRNVFSFKNSISISCETNKKSAFSPKCFFLSYWQVVSRARDSIFHRSLPSDSWLTWKKDNMRFTHNLSLI